MLSQIPLAAQTDFVAFLHKIRHYARFAFFFLATFEQCFGEWSNSAHLSERIANIIMISEEHWKNDETLFQSVYGHRCSVNTGNEECTLHIVFVTFCFMGTLARR